jgi:hypothetical protein
LWDTTQNILFRCGIKRKKNSCIVGYNARNVAKHSEIILRCIPKRIRFFPVISHTAKESYALYPTTHKVLFHCGIQQRKMIQRRINFLNFKCLLLTLDVNVGKNNYLNIQSNP